MSLNADTLIDRSHLKGQITKWRLIAIVVVVLSVVLMMERYTPITPHGSYVARVKIEGVITDDLPRDKLLKELAEDESVKAVIVRVDSPGGTVVGGEQLYKNIGKLSEVKPVVVVMRSMATSAGYMAVLQADHIIASRGTLTGSVGVLLQTAEVTDMAGKLGITPVILKSGDNKASPNPLEELTEENRAMLRTVVESFYQTFIDMVIESRGLTPEVVAKISDGRVFTGTQALEIGLIDALGDEEDAIAWLHEEKKIDPELEVEDRAPKRERPGGVGGIFSQLAEKLAIFPQIQLDGLVSIWQPKPM